jgi:hypothetical protein
VATTVATAVGAAATGVGVDATNATPGCPSGSRAFISTTPARTPRLTAATPASPDHAGSESVRRGTAKGAGAGSATTTGSGNATRVAARRVPQFRQ